MLTIVNKITKTNEKVSSVMETDVVKHFDLGA